jgi:hypothetical protein
VTFSIERTMPLFPLSGDKADEYANMKPMASCTVEFDANDDTTVNKANLERAKELVNEAMDHAQSVAFSQISDFRKAIVEMYEAKAKRREERAAKR